MISLRLLRSTPLMLLLALGLQGCAQGPALRPADSASLVNGAGAAAIASADGVEITARIRSWPGEVDIEDVVTPIQITIDNAGERPLRIRYSDFALVSEAGRHFAALPPYSVEGTASSRALASNYRAIRQPAFTAMGFRIAGYYQPVYPTMLPYSAYPFYADPFYYSYYYPYWDRVRVELPTPRMLREVIPEGVLDPGGRISGFLYFENVADLPAGIPIRFHAELVDATTGEHFATLNIPFVTDGARVPD